MRLHVKKIATSRDEETGLARGLTRWPNAWFTSRNALPDSAVIEWPADDPSGPTILAHELGHVLLAVARGAAPMRCLSPWSVASDHWPEEMAAWAIARAVTKPALWTATANAEVALALSTYDVPKWGRGPRIPAGQPLTRELVAWLAEPGRAEAE